MSKSETHTVLGREVRLDMDNAAHRWFYQEAIAADLARTSLVEQLKELAEVALEVAVSVADGFDESTVRFRYDAEAVSATADRMRRHQQHAFAIADFHGIDTSLSVEVAS